MAASNHTPGPHVVEQIGRRPLMTAVAATVLTPGRQRLADFRHVADANLFAAAPELLEMAQRLLSYADEQEISSADFPRPELLALISKATAA